MRFMMLIKADANSEAGVAPSSELIDAMGRYNEDMVKAGVLLGGDGLHPTSAGARVELSADRVNVTDGPFGEPTDLVAGFWLIQVKSKDEAIEWASRCPAPPAGENPAVIELRRVFELEDFPPDSVSPQAAAKERRLREQLARS